MIDKKTFGKRLKNQEYDFCSDTLRTEIINLLVDKIKKKVPNYKYSTITFLKNDCFKYLEPVEQEIATQLYVFSFNDDPSEFELSRMMEMYQYLVSN